MYILYDNLLKLIGVIQLAITQLRAILLLKIFCLLVLPTISTFRKFFFNPPKHTKKSQIPQNLLISAGIQAEIKYSDKNINTPKRSSLLYKLKK